MMGELKTVSMTMNVFNEMVRLWKELIYFPVFNL